MKFYKSALYSAFIASALLLSGLPQTSMAAGHAKHAMASQHKKHRVVFQVSDNNPKKWNLALNNANNVQHALGKKNVAIEIVVYGPGIHMLTLNSTVANRLAKAKKAGIKVVACENTMHKLKLTRADMLSTVGYVPGGVLELMKRQQEGWSYIRP